MVHSGYNFASVHLGQYRKQSSDQKYASRGGPWGLPPPRSSGLVCMCSPWPFWRKSFFSSRFFRREQVPRVLINHQPQFRTNPNTLPLILPVICFYPIMRLSGAFWMLACVTLSWGKREFQTLGRLATVVGILLPAPDSGPHWVGSAPCWSWRHFLQRPGFCVMSFTLANFR